MEKKQNTIYTLTETEVKDAIRRYFVDKLGTKDNFSENDIKLDADVGRDDYPSNFTATLTITSKEKV